MEGAKPTTASSPIFVQNIYIETVISLQQYNSAVSVCVAARPFRIST